MSKTYVIVGAGPVGRHTAEVLRDGGDDEVVVTRSGRSSIDGVESIAADASDPDVLTGVASGAAALFNCANPTDYTRWEEIWPPLAESLLGRRAHRGDAGDLVVSLPVRPDHRTDGRGSARRGDGSQGSAAGRHVGRGEGAARRRSDPGGRGARVGLRRCRRGRQRARHPAPADGDQGKTAWVIGKPDLPHTWTDVLDMARTLAAVADRPRPGAQVWHAPSNEPRSQRRGTDRRPRGRWLRSGAGARDPDAGAPRLALVNPLMREIAELSYMWTRPYVLSSTRTQDTLGLAPTPWDEVCRRTADGGTVEPDSPSTEPPRGATEPSQAEHQARQGVRLGSQARTLAQYSWYEAPYRCSGAPAPRASGRRPP